MITDSRLSAYCNGLEFAEGIWWHKPSDRASWKKERAGLNVSLVSTDELYLRSEVPKTVSQNTSREETGWRGERLNAQILVWSPDTLDQVRLKINDLVSNYGKAIGESEFFMEISRI